MVISWKNGQIAHYVYIIAAIDIKVEQFVLFIGLLLSIELTQIEVNKVLLQ
jgi:hypothetical protein